MHGIQKLGLMGLLGLVLSLGPAGCFFESSLPTSSVDGPGAGLTLLDKVPVSGKADSAINLYLPILDAALGAGNQSAARVYAPVQVLDHSSQKVLRYTLTTQAFGSWNAEREYAWNWFRLQTGFFFPDGIPDTAGQGRQTASLYQAIGQRDRFTRYVDSGSAAAEKERLLTTRSAALGLRLELDTTGDTLIIRQAVVDAPAWRLGARAGMRILAVNDSSVLGDSGIARFSEFSRGDSGVTVKLTLLKSDGAVLSLSVIKEPVDFPSVMVDSLDGIPVISVFVFAEETYAGQSTQLEFRNALRALGGHKVFVLDLRQNPGGSLTQCLQVADEMLKGGTLIKQEQRFFDENYRVPLFGSYDVAATSGGLGVGKTAILLADSGTASASEILLVSLRDGSDAPTVGGKTYGKGIGQMVLNTPGGGLSLITHLKFKAPKGEDYHGKGISPAYPVQGPGYQVLLAAVDIAAKWKGAALAKSAEHPYTRENAARLLEANRRERLWR